MAAVDEQVSLNLDKFFSSDTIWKQVASEVSNTKLRTSAEWLQGLGTGKSKFKVQVPKPYPGVQYRKSKNLNDRYLRYEKHGHIVTGEIEDNGEWLRIADDVFLPMRIGNIAILEPLSSEEQRASQAEEEKRSRNTRWYTTWSCGHAAAEQTTAGDSEVLVSREGARDEQPQHRLHVPPDLGGGEHRSLEPPAGNPQEDPRAATHGRGSGAGFDSAELHRSAMLALGTLPDAAAHRHLSDPINPFSDTPRGGSPAESPLRSRPISMTA